MYVFVLLVARFPTSSLLEPRLDGDAWYVPTITGDVMIISVTKTWVTTVRRERWGRSGAEGG